MELGSDVDDPCLLTSQTGSEIPILPSVCAEVSLVVSDLGCLLFISYFTNTDKTCVLMAGNDI